MYYKITDEQAKKKVQKILNIEDVRSILSYDRKTRNEALQKLKIIKGVSKAQLARVLGMNRKILERIMK